jgi:hypothetical protein
MSRRTNPKAILRTVVPADSALDRRISSIRNGRTRRRKERDEQRIEAHAVVERGESWTTTVRQSSLVIRPDAPTAPPVGIRLFGGCDLPATFELGPLVAPRLRSDLAIDQCPVDLSTCQVRMSLQALDGIDPADVAETCEVLGMDPRIFQPLAYRPEIVVEGPNGGSFPVSVVILSLGAEALRPVYRHREHGFLLDPGGMWLSGQIAQAMGSSERREWFAKNFRKVGRLDVGDFPDLYRREITEIQQRTGALVVVFNTLMVEPGEPEHNYQLRKLPEGARRREFHLALTELSAELDVAVLDIDRCLKRHGVQRQLDFAHFPTELYPVVATELAELLTARAILV